MTLRRTRSAPVTNQPAARRWTEILCLVGLAALLGGSIVEFHDIASGTGTWYAGFSAKWLGAFMAFCAACGALLTACAVPRWREALRRFLIASRTRSGKIRWVLLVILVILPVMVLQYTAWGVVIRGPFLRGLLWMMCLGGAAWAMCRDTAELWNPRSLVGAGLLSGSALVLGSALTYVTNFPFSLGWSEGNRLWDYSLAFGKSLYSFKEGTQPVAYLDIGRQMIGGLPFLLPHVSILGVRLWLALVATLPYLLVGWLAFFPRGEIQSKTWITAGLFGLLFLSQGPIHAPLVICAILVLLAWRVPLGWGAALMAIAGTIAETSRFTWMFAPAIWIVMLELAGASLQDYRIPGEAWHRALVLGACGLIGSAIAVSGVLQSGDSSVASSAAVSASQALLWYRLLPNATYSDGILIGLVKVAGPLAVVLVFAWTRYGTRNRMQSLVVVAALAAFLVVGLVVSTKIGGGGDLHNLDMFLLGLLLTAAVLWHIAGEKWLGELPAVSPWIQGAAALSLLIPGYAALMALQPISFAAEAAWASVLVGAERPRDLGSIAAESTAEASLDQIRAAVTGAEKTGPVLFMDQRQLLTFGYIQGVELLPEYEKKRLMDEALSGNLAYFTSFYKDLAQHRFALIISSPLRTPIKDSEYGFGEENNAWVQWVAKPVLCYYQELDTLNDVKVELLVPKAESPDCASSLPGVLP